MPNQDLVRLDQVELRHFRYFLAVANELHFGRAAEKLHMAQPPLSQQIRQLEEWVGHPLLARNSRNVRLTPAGEELKKRLLQSFLKLENDVRSVREVGRGQRGALDVGFIESSILTSLPDLLSRYRVEFPAVRLRLQEFHTSSLIEALEDGRMDVGFLRDAGPVSGLSIEPVLSEPFVALVPAGHSLAKCKSISVASLREEPFVLFSQSIGQNAWHKTVALCEEQGFRPNVVQEAPQWLTILQLVGAGIGITIAPLCVSQLANKRVASLRLTGVRTRSHIELAFRLNSTCAIVGGFLGLARSVFPRDPKRGSGQHTAHPDRPPALH